MHRYFSVPKQLVLSFFLLAAVVQMPNLSNAQNMPKPRVTASNLKISSTKVTVAPAKPRLVVGIVVDQMRWDYLYRFANRYGSGGFNRLLNEGFSCQNAFIPYTPTVTAAGHTCVYTGSVPAIHGIVGNNWWNKLTQKNAYCSEDASVSGVGSNNQNGKMSPKNMLATTIGDELRLATNFSSKVIGIAIKDRGAILPAGHSANAAYWYDNSTGKWITSTFYMNALPSWVANFNDRNLVDSFYKLNWSTLYPINTYTQSTADEKAYESKPFGNEQTRFPYNFQNYVGKNWAAINTTPYGNTFTLALAKEAIRNEQLGKNTATDMLCVSLSSTDYVGHSFGPNSIELEDTYLRLDADLAAFFSYLDKEVGQNAYTIFLTADHGVAHVPGFMKEHQLPGGLADDGAWQKQMNSQLKNLFGINKAIVSMHNYQVHLNVAQIDSAKVELAVVKKWIMGFLEKQEAVAQVMDIKEIGNAMLPTKLKEMLSNGYFPSRCGDIQIILKPGYIDGGNTGTTHGVWAPYDAHIPMLFAGNGIKQGKTHSETYMTDIAATIAALLNIQMPSGCIGKVINEVLK